PADDPVLFRLPRLAAVVGLRHGAAPDHAGLRAWQVFRRRAYANDAVVDAGSAWFGIHQAGPPEGPAAGAGDRQACAEERIDPGADTGRHQPRADDQRRRHRGDGVRLARRRTAALRGRIVPRLPRGSGCGDPRRRDDRRGEPAGGHPLCRDRPPHQTADLIAMSTTTETSLLAAQLPSRFSFVRSRDFPLIPLLILGIIAFVAVFADLLAPHDPQVGSLAARFHPPFWLAGGSTDYLLGTDQLGRDVLSRLIFGARVSMVVGFTAVIFAGVVGTTLGIISGYLGGWVDQVIMRVVDAWLALPAL